MKRFVLWTVLCVLPTSSAFADFYDVQRNLWTGEHDHFCGNTWINTSTTLNNAGSLIYNTSTLPANTGPLAYMDQWMTGDYWWGIGVLVNGSDGVTINNTGTIQSIVSGTGSAQAEAIFSTQSGLTVNNWGTIDGQVLNNDGEAEGVNTDSGGTTLINNGTISVRSHFLAKAVNLQNNVYLVNNGTIEAVADAGTQGITANKAYADCIGASSGGGVPMYYENNGQLIARTTSTTANNQARIFPCWANGPVVWKNTGLIYCANFSPNGQAQGFYYGVQSYDIWLYNSGTINNVGPGGYALWFENDGDRGDLYINNSGIITSPDTDILFLTGHWGPPAVSRTYYTNTGTYSGGQMRFYGIPATVYEAGQVHATLFGLSDASYVHIMGLPTIDPEIACGGNNSTLEFNLIGTLQQVNGNAASGTNLSAFSLGQSGSIVVSGKTYRWSGAGSGVSGIVNPGGSVPSPWQQQDIGAVGVAGGAVYCGGMFTVLASGNNIGGTADAFHYVHQSASSNCSIIAPVTVPITDPNAQAGVMIRAGLNANAANVFVGVTGINTVSFQYRSSDGGSTSSSSATVTTTKHWVKLTQNGNTFTGYYSVDGTNWTQLGTTTIGMGAANYMGLAFCNKNNSRNGMGTFYDVTCTGAVLVPSVPAGLTASAGIEQVTLNWQASSNTASYNIGRSTVSGGPYTTVGNTSGTNFTDRNLVGHTTYYYVVTAVTPGGQSGNSDQVSATPSANVPSPWVAQDIGPVGTVGSESYTNSVFTVSGSGVDIDNNQSFNVGVQDTCRFVYETNSGNGAIVARVTSVQNIDLESKAGVMIRSGLNADAANVFVGMTPGIGVVMSSRSTNGANATLVKNVTGLTVPYWVALVQNGSTFSGYYSADGNSWTLLGTETVSMTGTEYIGLAVSSRENYRLCTATFDNVSAPGWPVVAGPTGLTATPVFVGQVNLTWNALANATSYNVKRSTTSGGPYTTIASGVTTTSFIDLAAYAIAKCYYVVSAMVNGNETANSAEVAMLHPKLTGSIIGTPDSWNNSGNTIAKVFDNNLNTFFDAPDPGNGDWVGLNFGTGASYAIMQINYCPRAGSEDRMVGGIFQGANQANFSDAVTLFTVTTTPPSGRFTSVNITNTATFQYVRYLAPDSSWGNVAELEFYGYLAGASVPLPAAPGGLAAATVSSSQINLTWNAVNNVIGYNVKRSTTSNGPYTVVATGVTTTHYLDTGLDADTTYFYVVSGTSTGGEGGDSTQVSATTLPAAPLGLTATSVSASQINLSWNAVTNAVSYNIKRSPNSGGPYTPIATGVTTTNYTDTVVVGTKYYYVVSVIVNGMESSDSIEAAVNLPYPWMSQDIGSVNYAGSASISNGVFTLTGSGNDIWDAADAFRFAYVPVTGNCTIIARVASLQSMTTTIDGWAKAGLMIRESLNANSKNAYIAVTPGNGVTFQYRSSTGGECGNNNTTGLNAPYWVKLVRNNNTYTGYRSPDGTNWTQLGTTTITMSSSTVYIGLALTSHNNSNLCKAIFDNVTAPGWSISTPPAAPASLTATAESGHVFLTWSTSSNATCYSVKRATTSGGPYTILDYLTTTNYTDNDLVDGTTYYYVVSAVNQSGESANSTQASATTFNNAPYFTSDPITGANGIELYSYTGQSLAGTAIDPDNDPLTYSKVSGPAWLTVASNGALSGIPLNTDVGANSFIVRVTNSGGMSDTATLIIQVANIYSGAAGMEDLLGLAAQWLRTGCTDTPACNGADLDGDANVDLEDFAVLAFNWTTDGSLQLDLKFDETSGTTAADSSMYNRPGTLNNGPVWSAGHTPGSGALSFDGTNDSVVIPGYKGITGTSSRTCCAWIKTTTTGAVMSWGRSVPTGGDYWYCLVNYSASGNPGALHVSVMGGNVVGTTDLRDGQWHHIAVVFDSDSDPDTSDLTLYVDGVAESVSYLGLRAINTAAETDVYLGSRLGGASYLFSGLMDEVRIYNRALTAAEVANLAK